MSFKRILCTTMCSICTAVAVSMLYSSQLLAANIYTVNLSGGGAQNYDVGTTWDGTTIDTPDAFDGLVPTGADLFFIDRGDENNDYVYLDVSKTAQRYAIAPTASQVGALEVRTGAVLSNTSSSVAYVGQFGTGYLRVQDGATITHEGSLRLGHDAGGVAHVTTEGTLSTGGALEVGYAGAGTFNHVKGDLTIGTYLQVGRTGNGAFLQSGGDTNVNRPSGAAVVIASNSASAVGLLEISGGTFTVNALSDGLVNGSGSVSDGTVRVVGNMATIDVLTNYLQYPGAKTEFVIGSGISPINVGGNLTLDGTLGVSFSVTPTSGDVFTLMNYGGTLSGTTSFSGIGSSPAGDVPLWVQYGSGTDDSITVTVIPEPSSIVLLSLAGIAVVIGLRKRQK